ncbi:prepilin-type N-terminal cleavage/methylation domain-containing protein [Psychrobacter sp. CAL346-MNA-CIBAN-0220]|uniref:pilus assembly FimT family protein n=1 Tax=Psychrobacter sp. CAL346-MNA-CIBAN-0220 TaxID=3140457 RepID=UPI003325853B
MNSSSCQRTATNSGFTLIELMVTIAVLAIIVSIAVPNISTQLANQRVKLTAVTLTNALKEAKVESVIRRQSISLSYDNSSNPRVINIKNSDTRTIASYSYESKSTIKAAQSSVTFYPSKHVNTIVTYTVCDDSSLATPRQVSVTKLANITSQIGGTCS